MRETPLYYLLKCGRLDKERRALIRVVTTVFSKNDYFICNFNIEELLGKHNLNFEDYKLIRSELEICTYNLD